MAQLHRQAMPRYHFVVRLAEAKKGCAIGNESKTRHDSDRAAWARKGTGCRSPAVNAPRRRHGKAWLEVDRSEKNQSDGRLRRGFDGSRYRPVALGSRRDALGDSGG
jgi:hypothetical protein